MTREQLDIIEIFAINLSTQSAEVDEQKTKYFQHFINKHDTIVSN
jgi:hypothetical protein